MFSLNRRRTTATSETVQDVSDYDESVRRRQTMTAGNGRQWLTCSRPEDVRQWAVGQDASDSDEQSARRRQTVTSSRLGHVRQWRTVGRQDAPDSDEQSVRKSQTVTSSRSSGRVRQWRAVCQKTSDSDEQSVRTSQTVTTSRTGPSQPTNQPSKQNSQLRKLCHLDQPTNQRANCLCCTLSTSQPINQKNIKIPVLQYNDILSIPKRKIAFVTMQYNKLYFINP